MYFNLRNVPMFSGPYMITSVNHTITPGHFETVIEGIRQPTASLPKIENYIQSLKTTLLKTITDKISQEKKDKEKASSTGTTKNTNVKTKTAEKNKELTKKGGTKNDNTPNCKPNSKYDTYVTETPSATTANYNDVVSLLSSKDVDIKIKYVVFCQMYLNSSTGSKFQTKANNYSGVELNSYWGQAGDNNFTKKYYCDSSNSTNGESQTPYVFFESINKNIDFLISRYTNRIGKINSISAKDIAKFLILYTDSTIPTNENVYTSMNSTDLSNIESNVQAAINDYNPSTGNVSGVNPPNKPTGSTDSAIFENVKLFDTNFLQNFSYTSNGSLTGEFLVINQGLILGQQYSAKLYLAGTMENVLLTSFTINKNLGKFVTNANISEVFDFAKNPNTYKLVFIVKVDAFPNITYGFEQVMMPIDCPDKGYKYRQIIEVGDWDDIKDNICCNCYSKPYTGMQIVFDGKPCSKNGTKC
jgi:hypothetical protein